MSASNPTDRNEDIPAALPTRLLPMMLLFLGRHWRSVIFMFLLPSALAFLLASISDATRRITDAVVNAERQGGDAATAAHGPLLHFALIISCTLFVRLGSWVAAYRTRMPMMADMRRTIFAFVQRRDPLFFENNLSGKVAHKAAMLPDQLQQIAERSWYEFCPALVFFATSAWYLMTAKIWFAAFVMAWLVVYFGNIVRVARSTGRKAAAYNEAKAQLTGRFVDLIANIRNVISFAAAGEEDDKLGVAIAEARKRHSEFFLATIRIRFSQHVLNMIMWISLYVLSIYVWTRHGITVGDFVMITSLGTMMINRAQDVGEIIPDFLDTCGSASESIEALIVPRTLADAPDAVPLRVEAGRIAFDHVSFAYNAGATVFEELDLVIPAGQRVGLIGSSGAGKSTLVSLLGRMHDVGGGRITIDGQDVRRVTQDSLRRQIAVIPQDTQLFHRSLFENIRYGDPEATQEQVREAARRAFADDFIVTLPKGYDTLVGERGVKLSGGQRQRIAIARAFLKDAPLLILDEATSALDSESENLIQIAMQTAMEGRTVIAIAHRLSTIAHLDRLLVLDRGRIVEDGNHAELVRQDSIYAQMWRRQSGGFLIDDPMPGDVPPSTVRDLLAEA